MISGNNKFPLRTEFITFRAKAKRYMSPHTSYFILHTPYTSRLAVIVPKKLSKLATTRNWLKRLTYDTLWPILKDKNLDVVVIYKPLALKKSLFTKQQITHELLQVAPTL